MHGLGDTVVASRDPSRLSTLLETRKVARHDAQQSTFSSFAKLSVRPESGDRPLRCVFGHHPLDHLSEKVASPSRRRRAIIMNINPATKSNAAPAIAYGTPALMPVFESSSLRFSVGSGVL